MNPISARAVFVGRRRARGRGETIVFGILERHGKAHTEIVPNAAKQPLQAEIRGQVVLDVSSTRMVGGVTMGWCGG